MRSLPLIASLVIAALVVPGAVRSLRLAGLARTNYRGALLAFPTGVVVVAVALLALVPLALLAELANADVFSPELPMALVYVLGVALLGLLDDVAGGDGYEGARETAPPGAEGAAGPSPPGSASTPAQAGSGAADDTPRGLRGHARATARGRPSTGALKALGTLGLALFVLSGQGLGAGEYLISVAVLVLCTNFFNLLDLRPGRSVKALLLLGAGLLVGTRDVDPLWAVGLFVGPVVALLPVDLQERGMLGDTGSNAVGAVAGLWLVLALDTTGQAVALGLLALATAYGEFRSISALIDRTPGLRHIDSIGRASHA